MKVSDTITPNSVIKLLLPRHGAKTWGFLMHAEVLGIVTDGARSLLIVQARARLQSAGRAMTKITAQAFPMDGATPIDGVCSFVGANAVSDLAFFTRTKVTWFKGKQLAETKA